jgi:uroporphyrinogen decarboxylase
VPLIGFAGSPFTLACYMIEGGGSADFAIVRQMAYARRDLLARLVATNARAVTAYLNEQIAAGADAVMIFDTWGGLLTTEAYRDLSLSPMRDVIAGLDKGPDGGAIPSIVFTKGGGAWLAEIAAIGAAAVGLDWTVDMAAARLGVGGSVALQGNLDPVVLLTDPATVAREAAKILHAAGPAPGHIFNLGHGIMQGTPPENVAALVEAVHRISRETRARP